jgi:hypothetical protein
MRTSWRGDVRKRQEIGLPLSRSSPPVAKAWSSRQLTADSGVAVAKNFATVSWSRTCGCANLVRDALL